MTPPIVERLRRSHGTGDLHIEAADAIEEISSALNALLLATERLGEQWSIDQLEPSQAMLRCWLDVGISKKIAVNALAKIGGEA